MYKTVVVMVTEKLGEHIERRSVEVFKRKNLFCYIYIIWNKLLGRKVSIIEDGKTRERII